MAPHWVVVIEVTARDSSRLSIEQVRCLMELMAEKNPTTLYSPDRYALQVVVSAVSAEQALSMALAAWQEAQESLEITGWQLARTEVITRAEFERELDTRTTHLAFMRKDEGREEEDDLFRQAFHDPVTGLPGRALFIDHLRHQLLRCERLDQELALVVLELAPSEVVDNGSHEDSWDGVLAAVADRLTRVTRTGDSLARLSDNRFAVLLDDVSEETATEVAARLLSAIRRPVVVSGTQVVLPARVTVLEGQRAETAETLVQTAEMALRRGHPTGSTVR